MSQIIIPIEERTIHPRYVDSLLLNRPSVPEAADHEEKMLNYEFMDSPTKRYGGARDSFELDDENCEGTQGGPFRSIRRRPQLS